MNFGIYVILHIVKMYLVMVCSVSSFAFIYSQIGSDPMLTAIPIAVLIYMILESIILIKEKYPTKEKVKP